MASRQLSGGDPRLQRHVRAAFRGERMFLDAFEHTPVLDPTVLLETLKLVRRSRTPKTAFKSLFRFTEMVQMVGEMSVVFPQEWVRVHHGLTAEDFEFVVACWERAGRPRSGAVVGW